MPNKQNADRRHHFGKMKFKVRNWASYDAGLRRRSSLTLWVTFHLPLRQTEGFMKSIFALLGVTVSAADHSTLSRRATTLASVSLGRMPEWPLHVLIDSTGLKVYGAGAWRQEKGGARAAPAEAGANYIWPSTPTAA